MFGLTSKTAWVFLIVLGFFAAIVAFGNAVGPPKTAVMYTPPETSREKISDDLAIGKPIPEPSSATSSEGSVFAAATSLDGNLTKNLATIIGKGILDRNPDGPKDGMITVGGIDTITDQLLAELSHNPNPSRFIPPANTIAIIIDNSAKESEYLLATSRVLTEAANGPSPDPTAPIAEQMAYIANEYRKFADTLMTIPTPPTHAAEHREKISLILGKEKMFEAAANYDKDPLYALIALENINQMK